jgi:drug/metabolite transporter (DMT)-like permease
LLLGRSYELSTENLVGDALCLLAGAVYTYFLIATTSLQSRVEPWTILGLSTIGGAPALLAFARLAGENIWPESWTALLVLALLVQLVGQALLIFALGHFNPVAIGIAFLIQPVVGGIIGWAGYAEVPALPDMLGALCISAAILLVLRRPAV